MGHKEHFDLDELLNTFFDERMNLTFTSQPATIESFNEEENTVRVILDKEGLVLDDINISLFGNPESYITTPTLVPGTKGLLLFSKHDLNIWIEDGSDKHAKNDFSKNNAFFLIGVTNSKNKINYNTTAIEVRTNKGIETFSKDNTEINSDANINLSAVEDIKQTSEGKSIINAGGDIEHNSGASIKGSAPISIKYEAPSISIVNSTTSEELFSLLGNTLDTMQDLAQKLSSSICHNESNLSNASDFSSIASSLESLSNKFKGFN